MDEVVTGRDGISTDGPNCVRRGQHVHYRHGQKTKHIAIRFNLIREQVKTFFIQLQHLPTAQTTSDILTKALNPKLTAYLRTRLTTRYAGDYNIRSVIFSILVVKCFRHFKGGVVILYIHPIYMCFIINLFRLLLFYLVYYFSSFLLC